MFKNVVVLSLKLAMTTAHDRAVSADGSWTDNDDTIIKVVGHYSYLATGATRSTQGHAQGGVSADHRAACMVEATATLHARSDTSYGCGSLVWIHYDASHTDRIKSRAFIILCYSCHTRQDGRE